MTRRVLVATLSVAVLIVLAAAPSIGQSADPATPTVYRLEPASTYQHGCFSPCMCPVMLTGGVRGTFRLTRTGTSGGLVSYAVTNINWRVPIGTGVRITGSGTYKTGVYDHQQQLSLDLRADDGPVEHYDSGLVPGSDFPRIDIEISVHGLYCLDTVFDVHARPHIILGVGGTDLSWQPMPAATAYDVVRGDLQMLRQTGGNFSAATSACLANNSTGTSVSFGAAPPPGRAFWFLARELDSGVVGTYDDSDAGQIGSRDGGINSSPASCP